RAGPAVAAAGPAASRCRTPGWSLGAVAVAAVVALVLILVLNNNKTPEVKNVTVPTDVGQTRAEVKEAFDALNLVLVQELEESTAERDTPVRSDPPEGQSVPENTAVTV